MPAVPSIKRVLLVDDSALQRSIISLTLEHHGFEVTEAASGREALEICKKSRPDLVLSDWIMPGMNGLEFCEAFRAMPEEGYSYFILLTAKTEKEHVVRGLQVGADDFLLKPINTPELLARITAGERILRMQRELTAKNKMIGETLEALQEAHDLLDQDLFEAKKLQQSLVKDRYLEWPTGALSMMLHSAGHVGGDLVGYFPISENRIGLYAIDVSGHGVSSALMTARLAGYLSASVPEQNVALRRGSNGALQAVPPAQVLTDLNEMFLTEMETELYFTMVIADLDMATGHAVIAQAGHPHPMVHRRHAGIEQIGTGGVPIGLIADARYFQFEIQLEKGDRLLLVSDGVTECQDALGNMIEERQLFDALSKQSDLSGETYLESLAWYLKDYAGQSLSDDVSGILWEHRGA